jgi:hypothetical protein
LIVFDKLSNLKKLRSALADHIAYSEYFLGIHAFFDGEMIFGREVMHLNLEMQPFPIDFLSAWQWFADSLQGTAHQETFVYELPFRTTDEEDTDMEALVAFCRGSSMTVWLVDLALQQEPEVGRRYLVITIPQQQEAASFKRDYHGKDVRSLLAATPEQVSS